MDHFGGGLQRALGKRWGRGLSGGIVLCPEIIGEVDGQLLDAVCALACYQDPYEFSVRF